MTKKAPYILTVGKHLVHHLTYEFISEIALPEANNVGQVQELRASWRGWKFVCRDAKALVAPSGIAVDKLSLDCPHKSRSKACFRKNLLKALYPSAKVR